jgi:hypothetical protein
MIVCQFEAIHDAVAGFWLLLNVFRPWVMNHLAQDVGKTSTCPSLTTCPLTVVCQFEVIHNAIAGFWLLLNVFRPWVMSHLAQDVGKTSL